MMAACEISGLSAIADRFDHVLLDQWGTLHDGRTVFPVALDCLARLREAGKRVLVLSNSGKRASQN
ncbi:MAG: TIGR01459 family HAD-type hydrolase, partial [Bradyrhizobium sp.]|nr:TIGR01459 family HAD-type hydrolase [Bradyrhizobium sp.]